MLVGKGGLTLARDTMFAVIMIAVNGFAGLSLLIGGIKHKSQRFNIEGSTCLRKNSNCNSVPPLGV